MMQLHGSKVISFFFFKLHEAERALRVSNASLGDSETFPKRPFREKVFLSHTLNKHLKN